MKVTRSVVPACAASSSGPGAARRCTACPPGQIECGGNCIAPCTASDQCHTQVSATNQPAPAPTQPSRTGRPATTAMSAPRPAPARLASAPEWATRSVCDDGNECTTDTCDPDNGCHHIAVDDGTPCNDGGGVCQDGECVCVDPAICSADAECCGGVCTCGENEKPDTVRVPTSRASRSARTVGAA